MPASLPSQLAETFATVWQHFLQGIVPLWEGPGWNAALGLPYEALDAAQQPLPVQRYRAMACARQLFVFTSLGDRPGAAERAAALFASLNRHFADPEHGGWFYSVDALGAPLDTRKDLYTHAFILFACAHYLRRAPAAAASLDDALQAIQRFAIGDGLYTACLDGNWASLGQGPLQNPLMHLAEAFLAALDSRPDAATEGALQALCDGMRQHFFDAEHQVLLEMPCASAGNWYEPGHQFEWFYLLASSPRLAAHPLTAGMRLALARSEAQGLRDGAVCATLTADGNLLDGTRRIWAQAEYLRALSLLPERASALMAGLQQLRAQFLRAEGWFECRDAAGAVSRQDMPSTTPYHLYTCFEALAAAFSPSAADSRQSPPTID
ncbi:AGE family epimerase/isomerase [Pseudomonas sp. RIT-PI-S]|uniref:AGE family epimerase/isomerase n=1 Tax=Pseudomonas sp. RIT-PI-S TaxID=3035295 RepID=UPI0021D7FCFF|nr:AGE family epimerase/isomerase [Pseudomonas sp. RIT-PI-S]